MLDMSNVFTLGFLIMLAAIAAIGGFAVAARLRRWTTTEQPTEAFSMQDLREMRQRGQISDQEFETMRAAILGRRPREAPPPPSARDSP